MQKNKLVSIIVPCYNAQNYVSNLLDSVLEQTYDNIELIIVDDGSTDKSCEIIMSYKERFEEKGIKLVYIHQENAGAAAAINQGLKIFDGDYMMWFDSDDILMPEHIFEKVRFLEQNEDIDFAISQGIFVDESDLDTQTGMLQRVHSDDTEDNYFEDLLFERNVVYGPGTVMVRRESFLRAIPSRKIFESRQGQNWQLMLPLTYSGKWGYVDKVLFKCVEHIDSHSRTIRTIEKTIERYYGFEELITTTINGFAQMSEEEKQKYNALIHIKYLKRKLPLYYDLKNFKQASKIKKELKSYGEYTKKDTYFWYLLRNIVIRIKAVLKG